MRLFASEWLRFRSRKLIRWLAILGFVGIVVGMTIATVTSKPPTEAQLADAHSNYERVLARCIRQGGFGDPQVSVDDVDAYCDREVELEGFVPGNQLALQDVPEYLQGAAFIVVLIGLVSGASSVGASWQSGTITTILSWEPRRIRWFLTRLAALALGVLIISIALMVFMAASAAAGAALRGSTATTTGWLGDVAETMLRIALVAVGGAMLGATVAMIGRNTAAALGAVFVYMAVFESVVRGLRPTLGRFMLGDNIASFVSGTTTQLYADDNVFVLTPWRGALVIGVYVAVLIVASASLLRSRDVQ
jgi:ABC-2 type transport system permease protein